MRWYDAYLTQLKGIEVSDDYVLVKEQLVSWAANDICVYLQNISEAITENNAQKAQNALEGRARTFNDFNIVTDSLYTIGSTIEGANLNSLDFNPEKYYSELGGVQSEQVQN